jgi:predicted ester cyclase
LEVQSWPSNDAEAIVRRFYDELWNQWRLELADEIVSSSIRFRGCLGSTCRGRDAFKDYVERVRIAVPDWHNQVDELLGVGNRVAARLTWSGTQRRPLGDAAATGCRVVYVGAGFFRVGGQQIDDAWIVGDTEGTVAINRNQRVTTFVSGPLSLCLFRRVSGHIPSSRSTGCSAVSRRSGV